MKKLLNVLHPAFETLSAYADAPDSAEATRRHVASCEHCSRTLADIHMLGDAARSMELEDPPADLWFRIEQGKKKAAPDLSILTVSSVEIDAAFGNLKVAPAYASDAKSAAHRSRWPWVIAAAAAAIVAGILAIPARGALEASGVSRLSFSPGRAIPGKTITVRYRPIASLGRAARLVLVGTYLDSSSHMIPNGYLGRDLQMLGDSLAVLSRTGSNVFEGKLTLRAGFDVVRLAVYDPSTGNGDTDGYFLWGILAATSTGEPSLGSMLVAISQAGQLWMNGRRVSDRFSEGVVDSMTKYFPSEPAGWAVKADYGVRRGLFDYFAFFQTAERKYAQLYDKLMPQKTLSADRIASMAIFSWRIAEPKLAADWVRRLYREHPADSRLFMLLGDMVHDIELQPPAGYQDSIRAWIPALVSTYAHHDRPFVRYERGLHLIHEYGNAAQKDSLERLAVAKGIALSTIRSIDERWTKQQTDSVLKNMTAEEEHIWQERVTRGCQTATGKYPLYADRSGWIRYCLAGEAEALTTLSKSYLFRGNARSALAMADSAVVLERQAQGCAVNWWQSGASIAAARARAALGDPEGARKSIAIRYAERAEVAQTWNRSVFGASADSVRMKALTDSLRPAALACNKERAARKTAEQLLWDSRL